jgi:hypothetical protein
VRLADGELSPTAVAGYIAKYATKSTDVIGYLDRPVRNPGQLDALSRRVRPHPLRLVTTAWELGGRTHQAEHKLRRSAHTLGYGGHWLTKSRSYSTTFRTLRSARLLQARVQRSGQLEPLDAWGRPESERAVAVLSRWTYTGSGYPTPAERDLALATAARTREHRAAQREAAAARRTATAAAASAQATTQSES